MKLLLSSDWQAAWANLDKCRVTLAHVLEVCKNDKDISTVVFLGDLKESYNPVDIRVLNFWVHAVEKLRKYKLRVIIQLGNHDRIGMNSESSNWFPALRTAGADVIDKPTILYLNPRVRLFLVPYTPDPIDVKVAVDLLQYEAEYDSSLHDILLFHNEVNECRMDVLRPYKGKLKVEHLQPKKFKICVGGHIHLFQNVRYNVYYIGSPFAMDWGEANQEKGFGVYDTKGDGDLEFIPSRLPGMFDAKWPAFNARKP